MFPLIATLHFQVFKVINSNHTMEKIFKLYRQYCTKVSLTIIMYKILVLKSPPSFSIVWFAQYSFMSYFGIELEIHEV